MNDTQNNRFLVVNKKYRGVSPDINYQILNIELTNSLNGLLELHETEHIPKETLVTLTDMIREGFKDFFFKRYTKHMNPIQGCIMVCDMRVTPALGTDVHVKLNLSRMIVEDISGHEIIGHGSLNRFYNWLRRVDFSDVNVNLDFGVMYNAVEHFPNFVFRVMPNDFVYDSGTHTLYQIKEFVHEDINITRALNTATHEYKDIDLDKVALTTDDTHVFAKGIAELHELNITDYHQLYNFLTDEWYDDRHRTLAETEGGGYVAIGDMMEVLCSKHSRHLFKRLRDIVKYTPSDWDDVKSDFMVFGGAGGFKALAHNAFYKRPIKTHTGFENYLNEYEGLDVEQKGAISIFINNPSNLIRACIAKVLGDEGLPHGDIDMRHYYHKLVWRKVEPTTGRHTYASSELKKGD